MAAEKIHAEELAQLMTEFCEHVSELNQRKLPANARMFIQDFSLDAATRVKRAGNPNMVWEEVLQCFKTAKATTLETVNRFELEDLRRKAQELERLKNPPASFSFGIPEKTP